MLKISGSYEFYTFSFLVLLTLNIFQPELQARAEETPNSPLENNLGDMSLEDLLKVKF